MSGDRHLRPDPDGRLAGSPAQLATVLVKAEAAYAASLAGQHLLQMLVNLLARQFGVIETILVDVDDCPVHRGVFLQPRLDRGGLASALVDLGAAVGGTLTSTAFANEESRPSVVVYAGNGFDPAASPVPALAVAGAGWRAAARTTGPVAEPRSGSATPLGPHLAACVAAGFAFKSAYGKNTPVDTELSLWPGTGDGPELCGIELPAAYVLGLGAVGAASGYVLACARGMSGALVGVDPQQMSDTDRNRLLSGSWNSVGASKTDLFASLFAGSAIEVYPFTGRWPGDYLGAPDRDVPARLRADEGHGRFQWLISCVDRDRDRAGIAARLPRHILSGSTFGMAAQTAYYSVTGACECLGCRHRTPRQLGVEERSEHLRSLDPQARNAWYDEYGASPQVRASVEEYLSDPSCAGPGAADLARLGVQGRVDWAVGFVSTAAGVILAARFIRAALLRVEAEIAAGSERRLFFWGDKLDTSRAVRLPDCPVCGSPSSAQWHQLWGEST